MNSLLLAGRLGDDERRLRAALGWASGLDPSLLAWDTGLDPIANLHGASTDDGQHSWEILGGSFGRVDGNIRSTGSSDNRAAVIDVGRTDVLVAVDLVQSHPTVSRDHGLVLRATENGWLIVAVQMSDSQISNSIDVVKYDAGTGTRTELASTTIPAVNQFTPVRLFAQTRGNAVVAGINGIPLLRHVLSEGDEDIYIGTKVGIGTRRTDVPGIFIWRNFAVWRANLAS